MNPYSVLVRPLLSEKSNEVRETEGKYTFQVLLNASKNDIVKAVEALYNVRPVAVRTLITRGHSRRRGAHITLPKKTKKAVVTLPEGAKLPVFEEA